MWTRPVAGGNGDGLPFGELAWATFLAGMALTLGNPKIMVFYVALPACCALQRQSRQMQAQRLALIDQSIKSCCLT